MLSLKGFHVLYAAISCCKVIHKCQLGIGIVEIKALYSCRWKELAVICTNDWGFNLGVASHRAFILYDWNFSELIWHEGNTNASEGHVWLHTWNYGTKVTNYSQSAHNMSFLGKSVCVCVSASACPSLARRTDAARHPTNALVGVFLSEYLKSVYWVPEQERTYQTSSGILNWASYSCIFSKHHTCS